MICFKFLKKVAIHTRFEGHFKVWATNELFFRGLMQPTPGAETGLSPLQSKGCRLGYHPLGAWLVEQNVLPWRKEEKEFERPANRRVTKEYPDNAPV